MRIQLWSYNYDPEPTGIAPVSTVWAKGLRDLGHEVEVIAAHPHYPEPVWGTRLRPYREVRDGIPVLRLPLWIGRATTMERLRQELSFLAAQTAALPFLGRPDVVVSVSPSFPALAPGILNAKLRSVPWVIWLHDLLPDGASASGILEEGAVLRASRRLERAAYAAADKLAILSAPWRENLTAKGVPGEKIELIYDPATRPVLEEPPERDWTAPPRVLSMGNIGHTQGLEPLARAFDRSTAMHELGARLIITGNGVAAAGVAAALQGDGVSMLGLVSDEDLETELRAATIAFVSQQYEGTEFNLPSKIMNFMGYGLPIIAAVNPASETARLVREANAGWVVDSSEPGLFPEQVAAVAADPDALQARARSAHAYAREHFSKQGFAARFDALLRDAQATVARAAS